MSRVARKRAAKIERIHDVAASLFAERGFAATRMEDIAAGLDLQKASLYYYFDSKESLLASLVGSRVGIALEVLQEIAGRDAPITDRIAHAVAGHLRVFQEHADLYTIFNSERLHAIDRPTAERVNELGRSYERVWLALLEEGGAAGELRPEAATAVTVKAIVGALNSTLVWFDPEGRRSIEEVAADYAALFLDGLRSR